MIRFTVLAITLFVTVSIPGPTDDIARNRPVDEETRNRALDEIEGRPCPSIASNDWVNSDALDWDLLTGKVVMIDFWGAWCKPCVEAIPKLRKLFSEHQEHGFVIIGVHSEEAMKKGKLFVKKEGVEYPVVFDHGDAIARRFLVNHYPSYYLIDRQGRLRMADIIDTEIESAVEFLLNEEYEE